MFRDATDPDWKRSEFVALGAVLVAESALGRGAV